MRRHATRSVRGGFGSLDLRKVSGPVQRGAAVARRPARGLGCALQGVGDFQMRDRDARHVREA